MSMEKLFTIKIELLKLERESENGVAHPSRPRKREGRVLILGGGRKTAIIRSVAQEIRAHRS